MQKHPLLYHSIEMWHLSDPAAAVCPVSAAGGGPAGDGGGPGSARPVRLAAAAANSGDFSLGRDSENSGIEVGSQGEGDCVL